MLIPQSALRTVAHQLAHECTCPPAATALSARSRAAAGPAAPRASAGPGWRLSWRQRPPLILLFAETHDRGRLRRAESPCAPTQVRPRQGSETTQAGHTRTTWNSAARASRSTNVRIPLTGLTLAAACLAGFTTACSAVGPAHGTVTGHLYGVGGPATVTAPPSPRPWPGTVTVTGSGLQLDIPVGADGAYSVRVPPGRYTVTGRSPQFNSGAALCQAVGIATVIKGHTTKADVLCQML